MRDEGKRLKNVRKSLSLTQAVFAEEIGLKQGPYSMIESGKVGLSSDVLRNLIMKFKVNPLFLFQGMGPMIMPQTGVFTHQEEAETTIPPLPTASDVNKGDGISLSRLGEIRRSYAYVEATEKDRLFEELLQACMRLKDENSQQKDKIIKLMGKLQEMLGAFG